MTYGHFTRKTQKKTRKELTQHFQISKNKVYVLKTLIHELPPDFIRTFKDCEDKRLLRTLGREKLLEIIKLDSITKRREAINKMKIPPAVPTFNCDIIYQTALNCHNSLTMNGIEHFRLH